MPFSASLSSAPVKRSCLATPSMPAVPERAALPPGQRHCMPTQPSASPPCAAPFPTPLGTPASTPSISVLGQRLSCSGRASPCLVAMPVLRPRRPGRPYPAMRECASLAVLDRSTAQPRSLSLCWPCHRARAASRPPAEAHGAASSVSFRAPHPTSPWPALRSGTPSRPCRSPVGLLLSP
ncbi:uncharacterized protein [Miscanthus floridulus]|uniref:uncharacterized protein n=1 Tax=Miscanthus floridulus TaxID=154761 RepID=UPI003458A463